MGTLSKEGPLLMPPMAIASRPKSADPHVANTKPLRSSPLAGPALNRSLATPVLTVDTNQPTDPLLTVATPPICHVLHPKSSQNLDSCDSSSSTPTTSRRRGLGPITAGSGRSQSLYIPSTSFSDSGHASPSLRTRPNSEWEIDPLQSLSISRTPLRPRPSSGIASFRLPIPIVEEEPDWQVEEIDVTDSSSKDTSRNSSTSEFTNSRSSSQPQVNSWYTANTYDVTPRFSRLGLSASTVVMPLSPREHRRLSRNTSLANTITSSSSSTTSLPTKRFFIPSLSSKPSTPATSTRVQLQPHQPLPSQTSPKRQPLSRTFSSTTSSSETSSIASNSQCETPRPISTSTSSPSLTRSRSSEDSISTWYESLPPTTPHLEQMTLPAENDGEECERGKGAVDGGVGEFRGHDDRDGDLGQIHYSDITITIKSADDETRPDQVLMTTERLDLHPQPASQPVPQPTTNPPFQTPTFPKDIKKERGSLRKKLVRTKLQPVHDVDDLEDVSSPFSTLKIKTMTTMRLTTPILTRAAEVEGKVAVALPEVPVPVVLPASISVPVVVNNSEDTLLTTSSISLPISTSMKKRSTFKSVFKNFMARW